MPSSSSSPVAASWAHENSHVIVAMAGVFSAMTDKQIAAIATEMVKELDR